jgi:hypothetical protein
VKTSLNAPTKYEQARIDAMRDQGCVACAMLGVPNLNRLELNHMLSGGHRMGHWYSYFLCRGHHQGDWDDGQLEWIATRKRVAISNGRPVFEKVYGTERSLWERVQKKLKLPAVWPVSKIVARRIPHVDALRSSGQPAHPTGVLAGGKPDNLRAADARLGEARSRLVGPVGAAADVPVGVPAAGPGAAS